MEARLIAGRDETTDEPSVLEVSDGCLKVDTTGTATDVSDRINRLLGKITNYDVLASGTLGTLNATVELVAAGLGTAGVGITGTWVGVIAIQGSVGDGVWHYLPMVDALTGEARITTTVNGVYQIGIAGFEAVRVLMFAYTSGTATITIEGTSATAGVFLSKSIPTGINNIGKVGSDGISVSQTPTVTVGAYAANDAVGGLLTFAGAARYAGYGGVIRDVIILDDAGQDAELELWLFSQTFTAMADNAPWAPSEVDLRKLVAIISTGDGAWFAAGTPSAARIEVSQRYDCVGTSLFGQLVTRGTPTFAATDDVTVVIGLLQD